MMSPPVNILIASHSHPQLTKGGAEISAYQLFAALHNRPEYELSFLGCTREAMTQKLGATFSQPYSPSEYLYSGAAFDWFKFANTDPNFPGAFRTLLRELKPDIVHFHHYLNFGVEAFFLIRDALPNCRIVLTLHEYLAICNHYGQMVTKQHRTLCHYASPVRCNACFKEIGPGDFFLRNLYIQRFFDLVDHFIAPSGFLAERYVAWGLPPTKLSVIENIVHRSVRRGTEIAQERDGPLRVGFFGQVSELKGIGVLLEAAKFLEKQNEFDVVFEIFGDYNIQPMEFQAHFLSRLERAGRNVVYHGAYDQDRVDELMQSVDVVLMPSIWWENSPVVIQEALRNRRPIVCSGIGGMAEKVRDGIDGFHFPVGNAVALASLLQRLGKAPARLKAITESMHVPVASAEIVAKHELLYTSLLS